MKNYHHKEEEEEEEADEIDRIRVRYIESVYGLNQINSNNEMIDLSTDKHTQNAFRKDCIA